MNKFVKILVVISLILIPLFNFYPAYSFEFIGAHREYYGFGVNSFIREWFNGLAWDHPWNRFYFQWDGIIINTILALAFVFSIAIGYNFYVIFKVRSQSMLSNKEETKA